ncbi:hypothetical protein DRQ36_01195 [bacterium]|nr:MAG: hypothetical protein DRQ36_01195 [bacterium]
MKKPIKYPNVRPGIWLLIPIIALSSVAYAEKLPARIVAAAVQTWVRDVTADNKPDAVIERIEPYVADGDTVAYIAHIAGGGFCICGADNMFLPVYLYSPGGTYDPEKPHHKHFLADIVRRARLISDAESKDDGSLDRFAETFEARAAYWEALANGTIPKRNARPRGLWEGPDSMSCHLTSLWNQWSPYNDLCPELTPGADEHCVIGCVAGAGSAIMRYWEWPNTGVGNDSTIYNYRWRTTWDTEPLSFYPFKEDFNTAGWSSRLKWVATAGGRLEMNGYWDGSVYNSAREQLDTVSSADSTAFFTALDSLWNRLTMSSKTCRADFGTTTYRWDLMEDIHDDAIHDAGDTAVATLCYNVGVACEMDYGIWGSGAWEWPMVGAYEDHFRYDLDVDYVVRDTGDYASGTNDMIDEFQWLRPVQYYGWEMVHSWVIYGYNRTFLPDSVQFHMNSVNGDTDWVQWDEVYPNHCFIWHIAPQSVVRFIGDTNPGDGSPDDPYQNIEEAIADLSIPDGAKWIFKAGSVNTFAASSITINKPCTLIGRNAIIRKE